MTKTIEEFGEMVKSELQADRFDCTTLLRFRTGGYALRWVKKLVNGMQCILVIEGLTKAQIENEQEAIVAALLHLQCTGETLEPHLKIVAQPYKMTYFLRHPYKVPKSIAAPSPV